MLITFFRAIILYIVVLIVMRFMGKREIGQLQPFELAISIMIADLASIPMTETGIPIGNGIVPILGLLVMHLVISLLNIKSIRAREIVCGKPRILVYRGKIDEKVLKKERLTEYEGIPYDLVVDGKVMEENLQKIGKDYQWLKKQVEKFSIKPEQALVVTYDGKGQIFCQEKQKNA